jgi:DNA-binding CsgD family transcriptional regulator
MNPRSSPDSAVQRALAIWDEVSLSPYPSCEEARNLREEFLLENARQATGWLSLTCGRVAICQSDMPSAEHFLIDAMGRLRLAGDKYGEGLVESHMAIVLSSHGESEQATKLAASPFLLPIEYARLDLAILHNLAAMVTWQNDQCNQAIGHILSEFEIIRRIGKPDRHAAVLANLAAVLLDLGEFQLSLSASQKAVLMHQSFGGSPSASHLSALANLVMSSYLLGRQADTKFHANTLFQYTKIPNSPATFQHLVSIIEALCVSGEIVKADEALVRARSLSRSCESAYTRAHLLIGDAAISEAKKDYETAISLSKRVLEQPAEHVRKCGQVGAALIRSRSCEALGRTAEAKKWRDYAANASTYVSLTGVLIDQIQANLDGAAVCETLTTQELNCLRLSARGQSSSDIGIKLGIKPRTVNFHFGKILRKLNATNRQEAIAKAISANLISASPQRQRF